MTNILEHIVSSAIESLKLTTNKATFTVFANESTLEMIQEELNNYYRFNDDLIISNIGNDKHKFNFECNNSLANYVFKIQTTIEDDKDTRTI